MSGPAPATARPMGITILAVLSAIGGVLSILGGLALVGLGGFAAASTGQAALFGLGTIFGVLLLASGVAGLAFAYGAWTLQPWAWVLGVALQIISLVLAGFSIIGGRTSRARSSASPSPRSSSTTCSSPASGPSSRRRSPRRLTQPYRRGPHRGPRRTASGRPSQVRTAATGWPARSGEGSGKRSLASSASTRRIVARTSVRPSSVRRSPRVPRPGPRGSAPAPPARPAPAAGRATPTARSAAWARSRSTRRGRRRGCAGRRRPAGCGRPCGRCC